MSVADAWRRLKAKRAKVPRSPRRTPLNALGRIGHEQLLWNAAQMARWRGALGEVRCCVSGSPRVCVGHIMDRSTHPHLRMDPLNVAPISPEVNRKMKFDLKYRDHARDVMEKWSIEFWRGHPGA